MSPGGDGKYTPCRKMAQDSSGSDGKYTLSKKESPCSETHTSSRKEVQNISSSRDGKYTLCQKEAQDLSGVDVKYDPHPRLRVRNFSQDSVAALQSTVATPTRFLCKEEREDSCESETDCSYNIKECPYCKFLVVCKTESSFEDHLLICPVYGTLKKLLLKKPKLEPKEER
uniref:Uncharacterized protein n=1 Tax=Cacopsylla melanoneura TaxID=428564 RepID=A0A8D9AT18_9HEMI